MNQMKSLILKIKKQLKRLFNMKNWSTLQKGDKLYLLVPISTYNTDGTQITKYVYQESSVINVHQYENHINIRFKYTDANYQSPSITHLYITVGAQKARVLIVPLLAPQAAFSLPGFTTVLIEMNWKFC